MLWFIALYISVQAIILTCFQSLVLLLVNFFITWLLIVLYSIKSRSSSDLLVFCFVSLVLYISFNQTISFTQKHSQNIEAEILVIERFAEWKYIWLYSGDKVLLEWPLNHETGTYIRFEWKSRPLKIPVCFNLNIECFNATKKFDYERRLYMKWFRLIIKVYHIQSTKTSDDINISTSISSLRNKLMSALVENYWENKYTGLLLWIAIWNKDYLDDVIYDKFVDSWIVHLLAVSWWNLVILTTFLFFMLFFVPFYFRLVVIWSFLIVYALLCGLDSSVFRAMIMALLGLSAQFFGRDADVLRILLLAYIILLCFNPYFLLFDVWFILSFSAVVWIVFASKFAYDGRIKILRYISAGIFLPCLGAFLATAPIIFFFMGKINLFSIIPNIILSPLFGLITCLSFIIIVLASFVNIDIVRYVYCFIADIFFWIWDYFSSVWIYINY